MATEVRMDGNLLTIRLTLEPGRDGLGAGAELLRGSETLFSKLRVPLEALGFAPSFGGRDAFAPERPPERLWELLDEAGREASDEPIWLQIAYGARILSAYPWERALATVAPNVPALHIPNFARAVRVMDPRGPIAICLASPRAKGAPDGMPQLRNALLALSEADLSNPVLLFGMRGQTEELKHLANELAERFVDITVPAPPEDISPAARGSGIEDGPEVANPWLRWMADVLPIDGVAMVHFVCPGFDRDGNGALALPESPLQDDDARIARFVGAEQLATFCKQIGCRIMVLSAIGAARWRAGIRLLADELSWQRPCTIVTEVGDEPSGSWPRVLGALTAGRALGLGAMPELIVSTHPNTLGGVSNVETARVVRRLTRTGPLEFSVTALEADVQAEMSLFESLGDTGLAREDSSRAGSLREALDTLSNARPRSPSEAARDRGARRALEFLSTLRGGRP